MKTKLARNQSWYTFDHKQNQMLESLAFFIDYYLITSNCVNMWNIDGLFLFDAHFVT